MEVAPGQWMHCHEHFDEAFVARDSFYQDFLIPYGGRFLTSGKLIEDANVVFMLGVMRGFGNLPIGPAEMPFLQSLEHHAREALGIHLGLRKAYAELEMANALLSQFDFPMFLVDESRGIWHRNQSAIDLLARGDCVLEQDGVLVCRAAADNNHLTGAIRSLQLPCPSDARARLRRSVVTLKHGTRHPVRLFISAIRPHESMQAFGPSPKALVIVHEAGNARACVDPWLLAECFSLTPAEAKVAAKLATGATVKEISRQHDTAVSTVRSQVQQLLAKAGVERQSDLVGLIASMPLRR
jgi:DNA-binding CsgD family transcriptional regulator